MVCKIISTFHFLNQSWKADSRKVCIFRTPILQINWGWELNIYMGCSRSSTEYTVNSRPSTSLRPQARHLLSALYPGHPLCQPYICRWHPRAYFQPRLLTIFIFIYKFLPLGNPERCWRQPQNVRNWIKSISHRLPPHVSLCFLCAWFQRSGPECRCYDLDVIFGSSFSLVPPV